VPQATILDQIRKLVELQKIDEEIYRYKKEAEEKPAQLAVLQQQFEGKKAELKKLEEKSKTLLVERKSFEVELQSKEDGIAKANAQLSLLKTNREYTAKMGEIEGLKADKSLVEEKILLSYDEVDAINGQINKEKGVVAEEEKKYLAQKKEVDDTVKELQEKIKSLDAQRHQITPEISKVNLDRYEKILVNKHGLAIVPIVGNTCGGCYMNIPHQVTNDIRAHDRLVLCEMCARILYLQEEL
jgi:predicted  nucleic acid-binding Zn-ribbon protein